MKRTPLNRKTPLKSGGGLKRRAPVRARRARPREVVTEEVAQQVIRRSGGVCERCRDKPGSQLHHRVTRARGGPHDVFNLVHLCEECHHVWAHGMNEYPWLVPGRFLRGVYTGPDEEYRRRYNGDTT